MLHNIVRAIVFVVSTWSSCCRPQFRPLPIQGSSADEDLVYVKTRQRT
uniref:Uncharacterized protein n=1 Tax=Arundo donax TaxID=35708 RepID=A0A0A8Y4U2_ARUDO